MGDQFRTGLDWQDIRVFIALARYGSLSAAARALSVNHATVSRRISSLERALGLKLVERRPDGYVLTPVGIHALASANDMETAAATLSRGGSDDKPRGLVRINAPPSLTHRFLVTRLPKLTAAHSGLDIDLATDFRSVSLERRETDIALRFGRPQDGDVIAKHLVTLGFGFYASSKWRRRIKAGAQPSFVGFDETNSYLPEALWLRRTFPKARVAFRTSNQLGQAEAAKQDAGIAMLPHFIGRADHRLGLCRLGASPPSRELWIVTRRLDVKDLSIRLVVDHLMSVFREERELFEGSEGN